MQIDSSAIGLSRARVSVGQHLLPPCARRLGSSRCPPRRNRCCSSMMRWESCATCLLPGWSGVAATLQDVPPAAAEDVGNAAQDEGVPGHAIANGLAALEADGARLRPITRTSASNGSAPRKIASTEPDMARKSSVSRFSTGSRRCGKAGRRTPSRDSSSDHSGTAPVVQHAIRLPADSQRWEQTAAGDEGLEQITDRAGQCIVDARLHELAQIMAQGSRPQGTIHRQGFCDIGDVRFRPGAHQAGRDAERFGQALAIGLLEGVGLVGHVLGIGPASSESTSAAIDDAGPTRHPQCCLWLPWRPTAMPSENW